jgi:hypothetical protein
MPISESDVLRTPSIFPPPHASWPRKLPGRPMVVYFEGESRVVYLEKF